jgi:hypothetical protein
MLVQIIEGDEDFINACNLSFSLPIPENEGKYIYIPLIENGEDVVVTIDNRREYVALWVYALLKFKYEKKEQKRN